MKHRWLVLSLAVVAAGCGSTRTVTVTSTRTVTTTRSVTVTVTGRPPSSGFAPLSFSAVSDDEFWVLGNGAIEHTTDGGASFTRMDASALSGLGRAGATPSLRFADPNDGWAFVTGPGGAMFATHDGGATWTQLHLGTVLAFAIGGGYAYAVTADCTPNSCSGYAFRRTPVAQDAWTRAPTPFTPDGSVLDLAAHGTNLWLLGTRAPAAPGHDVLARSVDAGATFAVGAGPCTPGLGGDLEPVSATVVWAVCPTGMLAGAFRSTDGGRSFHPLGAHELVNSSLLAPASATTAVIVSGDQAQRTTDAGATWSTPATPTTTIAWTWAGFTDDRVGTAIVGRQLWRTVDGGADWRLAPVG